MNDVGMRSVALSISPITVSILKIILYTVIQYTNTPTGQSILMDRKFKNWQQGVFDLNFLSWKALWKQVSLSTFKILYKTYHKLWNKS
jgi:hypothetical protein